MKQLILTLVSILSFSAFADAQTDSINIERPEIPNSQFAKYHYDSSLQINILYYQYSNLWDIDGDGQKDSVTFIGNGGAHTYFHLKIWLTSKKEWTEYLTFYIDMPYFEEIENADRLKESYPQFTVYDFDGDGIDEIYLNLENEFASIPKELVKQEMVSRKILIRYEINELVIKEFN